MEAGPEWMVFDSIPIRDLAGEEFYKLPNGNMKKVGGDIHHTLDINPDSPTFGEVHSTLRLPGNKEIHFP